MNDQDNANNQIGDNEFANSYTSELRRQTLFFGIIAAITSLIFVSISLYNHVSAARYNQIEQIITTITSPIAGEITPVMREGKSSELQLIVNESLTTPYVVSLNVFDINGEVIAASSPGFSTRIQMQERYVRDKNTRIYIEPAIHLGKQIGFIQFAIANRNIERNFSILKLDATVAISALFLLFLALVGVIVFMLKRLFYKFSQR